jgi:hypothetical protein
MWYSDIKPKCDIDNHHIEINKCYTVTDFIEQM